MANLYHKCKSIDEAISDNFLLTNIDMYKKKQTFNKSIFLALRTGYGSEDKSIQDFMEILFDGKEAYEQYINLIENEELMLKLQCKFLNPPQGEFVGGNEGAVHHIYDINNKTFKEKMYYFKGFLMSTSGETTLQTSQNLNKYKEFLKQVVPELYLWLKWYLNSKKESCIKLTIL